MIADLDGVLPPRRRGRVARSCGEAPCPVEGGRRRVGRGPRTSTADRAQRRRTRQRRCHASRPQPPDPWPRSDPVPASGPGRGPRPRGRSGTLHRGRGRHPWRLAPSPRRSQPPATQGGRRAGPARSPARSIGARWRSRSPTDSRGRHRRRGRVQVDERIGRIVRGGTRERSQGPGRVARTRAQHGQRQPLLPEPLERGDPFGCRDGARGIAGGIGGEHLHPPRGYGFGCPGRRLMGGRQRIRRRTRQGRLGPGDLVKRAFAPDDVDRPDHHDDDGDDQDRIQPAWPPTH